MERNSIKLLQRELRMIPEQVSNSTNTMRLVRLHSRAAKVLRYLGPVASPKVHKQTGKRRNVLYCGHQIRSAHNKGSRPGAAGIFQGISAFRLCDVRAYCQTILYSATS